MTELEIEERITKAIDEKDIALAYILTDHKLKDERENHLVIGGIFVGAVTTLGVIGLLGLVFKK